jgi:hypothetical protein
MMYQVLIQIESLLPSPALGRFDQYTWPFLKRDLEAGRITLDEAQEIVDAFFLKANCFYGAGPAKLVNTTGIGNTYQHTTIGGVDRDTGEDEIVALFSLSEKCFSGGGRAKLLISRVIAHLSAYHNRRRRPRHGGGRHKSRYLYGP